MKRIDVNVTIYGKKCQYFQDTIARFHENCYVLHAILWFCFFKVSSLY